MWITTSDVTAETWRLILEYANEDIALEAIARVHGQYTDKTKSNYKKQAKQIRVSLLQAREYFLAAESSTPFTSVNHLYYCMMSLATSIMLLHGDGEKSLDRLRQDQRNKHHGLDFKTGLAKSEQAGVGLNILKNSYVEVQRDGHFINWYSTLPPYDYICSVVTRSRSGNTHTDRESQGNQPTLPPSQIVGHNRSILNLLLYLPDLHTDLIRYKVCAPSSRVNYEIYVSEDNNTSMHKWRIHNAIRLSDLDNLLEGFKVLSDNVEAFNIQKHPSEASGLIIFNDTDTSRDFPKFQYPSIREALNHDQIMYVYDLNTHQLVDAYLASFALSMLSRYYPDMWINCLESHCKAAQLIERFVFVMMKKFPSMALSVLASEDVVISTFRPPWY